MRFNTLIDIPQIPLVFIYQTQSKQMRTTTSTFILAAIAALSSSASAQVLTRAHHHFNPIIGHKATPKPPHLLHHSNLAAKTTATDERLLSSVELEYDGATYVPVDSTILNYTGTKGGYFDDMWYWWGWNFDVANSYEYNSPAYELSTRTTFTYDASGNRTIEQTEIWDGFSLSWENQSKTINTYDASNKHITAIQQDWNSSTSTWDNNQRTTYTYTSADLMESYTYEDWDASTSSWENFWKSEFTWSGTNMIGETGKWWTSPAWENYYRGTYTYDASDNRIAELEEYWSGTAYDTSDLNEYSSFVGSHQPQTMIYKTWDATTHTFENAGKFNITYNTGNKPVYMFEEEWDAGTSTWQPYVSSFATRYHYENYSTTAGVYKVTNIGGTAQLFPVPASNNLTININWDEAQPFTATITDMCGRTHITWSVASKKQYQETLSVNQLPAGSYVLTLRGAQGTISQRFSVIK